MEWLIGRRGGSNYRCAISGALNGSLQGALAANRYAILLLNRFRSGPVWFNSCSDGVESPSRPTATRRSAGRFDAEQRNLTFPQPERAGP